VPGDYYCRTAHRVKSVAAPQQGRGSGRFDNMLDRISEVSRWFDRMFAGIGKASKSIVIYFLSAVGLSVAPVVLVSFLAFAVWSAATSPPTPTEQATRRERDAGLAKQRQDELAKQRHDEIESRRLLCRAAAACKKYSEARFECATAGNLKTCLRIKMGDDAPYSGICSGYDEAAPAVPLPPETPDAVTCFFLTLLK
jgi:hypothetical protein